MFGYSFSQIRKFVVALLSFVLTVLSVVLTVNVDLLPASWLPWIVIFVAVCGSYGVFRVPNNALPEPPLVDPRGLGR